MSAQDQNRPRKWLIIIPLIIAVAVFVLLIKNRTQPEQAEPVEKSRAVRIIEVPSLTVVPRAVAYGNVEPAKTWEAVAEVSGRITELHPQLKNGELIAAGDLLIRIESTDYELAAVQVDTDIQGIQAQLAELEVRQQNTAASLEIEQQALALSEKELERNQALVNKGTVTRSAFEQEQRALLAQRQNVQSLQNTLNLLPAERQLLQAQLARQQAQRQSALLNLERTTISAPFAGRVAQVNVENTQYVRQGEVLATLDSIDMAEITVHLPVSKLRPLIPPDTQRMGIAELDSATVRQTLGFSATVRLPGQGLAIDWPARFVRASDAVDTRTRTLGLVVAVDEPYRQAQPGIRPPLVKGMFAEVELRGKSLPDSLVIPRNALHQDQVYLVDDSNRLQRRKVSVQLQQSNYAVISEGLSAGEKLIVSDLFPAVDGMLLEPVNDPQAQQRLSQDATGEGL